MKSKILKVSAIILLFSLMGAGCEKENFDADPTKAILGKWEVIENSYGSISYPGAYEEYRQDSILFNYNSENDTNYSKYWIEDSVLYKNHHPYKIEFLTYNKLQLVSQYPAVVPMHIYKRIK